jgi:hypothetical protein
MVQIQRTKLWERCDYEDTERACPDDGYDAVKITKHADLMRG